MPIALDPRIALLFIALGCAYVVSPALAGILATLVVLTVAPVRLRLVTR